MQIIQNSTLCFISDYLDIARVLINKYHRSYVNDIENRRETAMKRPEMFTIRNRLQERLKQYTGVTSLHRSKYSASNFQFPPLFQEKIRELTFGNIELIILG